MKFTANFSSEDYKALRLAGMKGQLTANFIHSEGGDVTFTTNKPHQLCQQLSKIIDAGASSWHEIFDITPVFY